MGQREVCQNGASRTTVLLVGLVVFLTLVVLVATVAMGLLAVFGFLAASGAFLGFAIVCDGVGSATAGARAEGADEGPLLASAVAASSSGSGSFSTDATFAVAGVVSGVTALTLVSVSCEGVVSAPPVSANTAPPTISNESVAVTHRPARPERRNSGGTSISRRGRWGGSVSARWARRAATASASSSGLCAVLSSMTIVF